MPSDKPIIISQTQLNSLLATAASRKISKEDVDKVCLAKYGKAPELLTLDEYNAVMARITSKDAA